MKSVGKVWGKSAPVLVGVVVAALALGASARSFAAGPTTVAQPNVGAARMSVSDSGGTLCVHDTANSNNGRATGVESWDIVPGSNYTVTLTDVTDCTITNNQIQVIVRNSDTGNQCLTATCSGTTCTFQVNLNNAPGVVDGSASACNTYPVSYCTSNCATNTGSFAQRSDGLLTGGGNPQESHLRAADFSGSAPSCGTATKDEDCGPEELTGCQNVVGSRCCALSQGCFGAWNSQCNCTGDTCNPATGGTGYVSAGSPGSACVPVTVGSTNTLTIQDQLTLIAELPAKGSPGTLSGTFNLAGGPPLPGWSASPNDSNLGGTNGQGGGSLTGQVLAGALSECLGSVGAFSQSQVTNGLGLFQLPTTGTPLCTRRAGEDKHLDTGDDISEAFSFPACVSGMTIGDVQACANAILGGGSPNCTCSAGDVTLAMAAIISAFDGCAEVIQCADGITSGQFDSSTGQAVAQTTGSCGPDDAADLASVRANGDEACAAGATTHGAYVSCMRAQAKTSIGNQGLRQACNGKVAQCAAKSTHGTSRVTCCRTSATGVTRCSLKPNAAYCTAPSGGSACVGSKASCCDACSSGGCN